MHHHPDIPFSCHMCEFRGLTKATVLKHKGLAHKDKKFKCPNSCGKGFTSEYYATLHGQRYCSLSVEKSELIEAELNDDETRCALTEKYMKKHQGTKKKMNDFRANPKSVVTGNCTFCDFEGQENEVRKHEVNCAERRHFCPDCPNTFEKRSQLREHMEKEHGSQPNDNIPLGDNINDKVLQIQRFRQMAKIDCDRDALIEDLIEKANKKASSIQIKPTDHKDPYLVPTKCSECVVILVFRRLARHHTEHHDPALPEGCPQCSYRSLTKRAITCHVARWHSDDLKTTPCSFNCRKYFSTQQLLKCHVQKACRLSPEADIYKAGLNRSLVKGRKRKS